MMTNIYYTRAKTPEEFRAMTIKNLDQRLESLRLQALREDRKYASAAIAKTIRELQSFRAFIAGLVMGEPQGLSQSDKDWSICVD